MDTAKNWQNKNPILENGQIGVEQDTCFIKVGDGKNTWNLLSYISTPFLETKLDKNATAQKAIRDNADNIIDQTYIKDISIEDKAITFTKGNGTNKTIYTTDTTYSNATSSSDGLMSKEDKIKLDTIKENAEENQNTFANIAVGSTTISADLKTDTLTIKSGTNIDISGNNLDDSITFSLTGTVPSASSATKSTQDSLGQNIHETYIKSIQGNDNRLTITKGNNTNSIIDIDNVPNSIKATQDSSGQVINSTYIKDLSIVDNTLMIYKGNGTATGIDIISFDQIYPVGCIYISVSSTSPSVLFKMGTWEPLPAGRILLAQGNSDWGTNYSAGSTGGEATHTLTLSESAAHNHTGTVNTSGSSHTHTLTMQASHGKSGNGGVPRFSDGDVWSEYKSQNLSSAGEHTHTLTINNSGGGQPHNNMQPYLSVYMWKRTN